MFPIAMRTAEVAGINVKQMSYAVMLGASDYSTPFGYQTNLMVYGPGGYKVRLLRDCSPCISFRSLTLCLSIFIIQYQTIDYIKFGFPLQITLWIVSTWVLSVPSNQWYVSWIVTFVILVVVAVVRLTNGAVLNRLKAGSGQNHDE